MHLFFRCVFSAVMLAGLTACGGGGTPSAPAPSATAPFNDWPTYGFDNHHDGFNPNTAAITPASLPAFHLAWEADLAFAGLKTETEPVVATNVGGHQTIVFAGGGGLAGDMFAFDGQSGAPLWTRALGIQHITCVHIPSGVRGIAGTPVYDPSAKVLYAYSNQDNPSSSAGAQIVYRLDAASGAVLGNVNVDLTTVLSGEENSAHAGLTLGPGGRLYAATSSVCSDTGVWRGRVAAVDTGTLSLQQTFFPTATASGTFDSGAGIWSWGGVSLDDAGNVYAGIGNTSASDETIDYGDHFVALSADLSTVLGSNYPGFAFGPEAFDLDFAGTPVLFQPVGCDTLSASEGKSGQLIIYDTRSVSSGPLTRFQLSRLASPYFGNAAYSPLTGLLYATVDSQAAGTLHPPGLVAIKPSGCTSFSPAWNVAFGPDSFAYPSDIEPRSAPTVTAGGVVFVGTPCTPNAAGTGCTTPGAAPTGGAVWAVDASSGALLNGAQPILVTKGVVRMAPVIDGTWMWVTDDSGALYALTIDPSFSVITNRLKASRLPGAPWH